MIFEENIVIIRDKNYVTMTYEKMDNLFSIVDEIDFSSLRYYPSMKEIELMKIDIPKYYAFILWILSNPAGPETMDEVVSEKELNRIVKKYTRLKKQSPIYKQSHSQNMEANYDELYR